MTQDDDTLVIWRDIVRLWRSSALTKRVLGASLAANVAWEFAGALGFPTFQAWSSHSQTAVALLTFMAAIWLTTRFQKEQA